MTNPEEMESQFESLKDYMKEAIAGVVSKLDSGFKDTATTLQEMKTSLEYAHTGIEELRTELANEKKEKEDIKEEIKEVKDRLTHMKLEIDDLKRKSVDSENRSRRNCLEFVGVNESVGETEAMLETSLLNIISSKMRLTLAAGDIERCHRLGSPRPGQSRSAIVRFLSYKTRDLVWQKRTSLKGTSIFLSESFAQETRRKRTSFMPYLRTARNAGEKAYLVQAKLRVGNNVYDNMMDIPSKFVPSMNKEVGENLLFFGRNCPLSNFYSCQLSDGGVMYNSVEQYYHAQAAKSVSRMDLASEIMQQKDPAQHKRTTGRIMREKGNEWRKTHGIGIMKKALELKFTQNLALRDHLKKTNTKVLLEANRHDAFWGIGKGLWEKDVCDSSKWIGQNQLGKLLMELRETID